MAADFSRIRSNPLLDYAAVELKQGGVLLDADANELVAILDRRLRALASDVLGRATVSATTPDAFRITQTNGTLQIGRGRLYVDGLLAENHGHADPAEREFDELLAEPQYTQPIEYAQQPYLPDPPALPRAGRHLVYLDVWEREITHLEQPDLVEVAVGVETSSRLQTVWQVRVLEDDAGANVTCASPDADVPGWETLIAPSTGRLTTGTYEVSEVTDPCELPPMGGYRGLENQLYRVEIHDAGQPGAGATFKWSRENASIGSRVISVVSATTLELQLLGRDEVLRFNTNDWVEITDDVRELSQRPGEIRRITVEEATRRISFTPALPADLLPAAFPNSEHPRARNLRVRRWDQQRRVLSTGVNGATALHQDLDEVGSTGVINVPAAGTTLLLENGVTVSFSSIGATGFKSGDYWVFAARTADATVELLEAEPPRGIHHHYARLAIWEAPGGDPTDCRTLWPPQGGADCSCTACVTPESHASGQLTLQAAVDRVRDTGGTVCLHAGQYVLAEAVRLNGARSIRISGQGSATVIAAPGSIFEIVSSTAIAVENLALISLARASAISVRSGAGISLRNLVALVVQNADFRGTGIALSGVIAGISIRDNLIVASDGIRALEDGNDDVPFLITAALQIQNNILWCQERAIEMDGVVAHLFGTRIADNEIVGCRSSAIEITGLTGPGSPMHISGNTLNVNGPGIRCSVDGTWIRDNKLRAAAQGDRVATGAGVTLLSGLDQNGSDQCQVLANQIEGFPEAGISVQMPARDLIIKLNIIERCGNGIVMLAGQPDAAVSIENNHLRDIGLAATNASSIIGIGVTRTASATIAGNTMRNIGEAAATNTALVAGIAAFTSGRLRITGNEITGVTADVELRGADVSGVLVRAPYQQAEISANHIERELQASNQETVTAWSAVNIEQSNGQRPVNRAGDYTTVHLDEGRTLVLHADRVFVHTDATVTDVSGARSVLGSSASLRGNLLSGRGVGPLAAVVATRDVQFSDNRCEQRGNRGSAVRLQSSAAVVSANVIRGGEPSLQILSARDRTTVLGNATTSAIIVGGQSIQGTPWELLNVLI